MESSFVFRIYFARNIPLEVFIELKFAKRPWRVFFFFWLKMKAKKEKKKGCRYLRVEEVSVKKEMRRLLSCNL